jgi:hypothetical protein
MAIQRLPVAYRSRSRPSSALGAKASTVCPYYLDGDLDTKASRGRAGEVLRVGDTQLLWLIDATWERGVMVCCAVLKVREEAFARHPDRVA